MEVTGVAVHRYFEAIPHMPGHKGIASVFLNHHFVINNVIVTRPAREGRGETLPSLTIKYPRLTSYTEHPEGGHDKSFRCIVTPKDEALHKSIEEKVVDTFNGGYLDVVKYLRDGAPVPREAKPVFNCGVFGQPTPEFTDIRFYKFLPAHAEGPLCRYDTYLFSCKMEGLQLCELRLVIRPDRAFVAVPTMQKYEMNDGSLSYRNRPRNLITPVTRNCRTSLERAANEAFKHFCDHGLELDDGKNLPEEVVVRAGNRRGED